MRYQALLFDLDGTLVDSVQELYLAVNLTLSEIAFPLVAEYQVREWVGNGIETLVQRALSGAFEVDKNLPEELSQHAIAIFKQRYAEIVGQYARLYPGVLETLQQLRGIPKALVTNKARSFTQALLQESGLIACFEVLVCGDDGEKKPAPSPLLQACAQLGVAPSRSVMIGDSKSDLLAARNAGMASIALTYGYHQGEDLRDYNPEYLCHSFSDIIPPIMARDPGH